MPKSGTTSARKRFWLEVFSNAISAVGVTAKQDAVIAWVEANPEQWNHRYRQMPADSTARGYIKELLEGRGRPWMDQPWSIGSSYSRERSLEIPPEALPDIVAVWRMLIVGGRVLTRREAVWVSRLRPYFLNAKVESAVLWNHMYTWAAMYAAGERAAESLGEEFDSSGLDASIAFVFHPYLDPSVHPDLQGEALVRVWSLGIRAGILGTVATDLRGEKFEWPTQRSPEVAELEQTLEREEQSAALPVQRLTWWQRLAWMMGARWCAHEVEWSKLSEAERDEILLKLRDSVVNRRWEEFEWLTGSERMPVSDAV